MKISKTALLALSGALSIAGLGLMFVSADKSLNLTIDPNNAVQHIETVKFISGSTDGTATLQQVGNSLVGIITEDNFTLSKEGEDGNVNDGNKGSSILGGIKNQLKGSYNVILGGEGNKVNEGMNNVILGGNGNTIKGGKNDSTIVGGKGNTINESIGSVIVGGGSNDIIKKATNDGYSVVVGSNSSVKGNNSTALGVESKVDANNSFLWTDRDHNGTLSADGAFAVVGRNGMVIGTNQAHSFAQLTLNGGLVIRKGGSNLDCNSSNGGSLKVVDAPSGDGRICLCSCDGYSWNSMFGLGQCKLACDSRYNPPVCGTEVVKICGDGDMNVYSGSCEKGEVVEGDGAYLVTKDNMVHWSCQTDDALVVNCVGVAVDKGCNVHGVARPCRGTRPGEGQMYKFGDGGYLPGHTPIRWTQVEDTKELEACEWRCNSESGYLWNGTMCVLTSYDCGGVKPTGNGYIFGETRYLYGTTPNTWGYTGSLTPGQCQYTCDTNYTWNGSSCVANTCKGTLPDHATLWNSALPSNNTTNYEYSATTTTAACKFKCDTNYTWNATTEMCELNACQGTLPTNAILWNSTAIPSNNSTNYEYSASSTTVACKFRCNVNYTWKTATSTCELNACQGTKPTNATLNSNTVPSNNTTNYFCDATSTAACAYTCPSGYKCNTSKNGCDKVTYSCQGTKPTNATLNSNTAPSNNTTNYFCDATSTAACAYTCPSGYKCNTSKNGCDKVTYSCQGTLPNHASLWNSNTPSNNTTYYVYSASSTSTACRFKCDENYTWKTTTSTCELNACQGTKPTNATLNSNTVPSNNTTSYFCDATSTAACAYTCPSGYKCNTSKNGCDKVTYSCQGTKPTNATLWNSNTPSNNTTYYEYSASSTSTACKFKCNTNYTWNSTSKECELNACQGTKPTNATLNSNTVPSNNTTSYFCDATSEAACAYTCPSGYKCNTSKNGCDKVTYSCQGTLPDNATLWNSNTPSNDTTYYVYSASSTSTACRFRCNTNYTWKVTTSTCELNVCQGTKPANTTLWNPSAIPSNNSTNYEYSSSSTTAACKFKCDTNYTWNSTSKECKLNACQGTKPANTTLWNPSAIPSNNSTNYEYSSSSTTAACKFKCDTNYTWNSTSKECKLNACQGTLPDNATLWNPSAIPSNNSTNYEYSSSSTTAACKFKCIAEGVQYRWNSTEKKCEPISHVCQGTLPNHASLWNSTAPSNDTTYYVYSASSTTAACKFKCDANYTWKVTTSTCEVNVCQGTLPDNATLWDSSAIPSNNSTNYEYSSSSTTAACKFKCDANYTWNSTSKECKLNACQGTLPSNATLWNSSAIPSNNSTNYEYSSSSTTAACKFKCDTNYTWNSTSKECKLNVCQGTKPANTTLWNPSAIPSNNSTNYEYSSSSTTAACKFKCNTNYTWNSTSKECKLNTCQGTLPTNAILWNSSAIPSNNSTSYSYSATTTTAACKFKCPDNYTYNSTTNECVGSTQTVNCGGSIPTGAEKKTGHGTYTQTWDGTSWTPTKSWSYNADVCGYLCDTANGYKWNTTVSMCVKCQGTLPSNATLWNSSALPSNNSTSYSYSATSTTVACKFKCPNNYTWNGSDCVPAQKLTVRFYANGNKIPVAQNTYETNYIESECTVGSNGTCDITSPSITVATNTPTVIGWSTAADRHESDWAPGTTKTISSNGTYYAQTKKDGRKLYATFKPNGNRFQVYTNSYTTDDIVNDCTIPTVYNGSTQATSCNVLSPTIAGLTDSRVIIGFSSSANSHTNEWSPNTSKAISSDVTYYAQTKKDAQVKVTFRANGNKVQNDQGVFVSDDVIKTCSRGMYYNGSTNLGSLNPTCSITSPYITATTSTPTVIGWSTAADRHEKDWTVGASLGLSATHVEYFAQTKETKTLKIKLEKDDTVSSISESGEKTLCTVNRYNGGNRTPSTCTKTFPTCTYDSQSGCHESCRFYTANMSNTYVPGQGYSFNVWDDASIIPVYTARAPLKKFTITYNPNGGKWSDGTTSNKSFSNVNCGNITLEAAPTKDNNDFIGWYTALEGGTYVGMGSENYALKQNVTLYAHWSPKSYSCGVNVNSCGGSVTATNSDENDSKWRWYCGTKYCYKCKDGYNDQGEDVCSEPTENGVCAFDGTYCSAGTPSTVNDIGPSGQPFGKVWNCLGKGGGSMQTCILKWECAGTCSVDSLAAGYCDTQMYVGYSSYSRADCVNAAAYYTYSQPSHQVINRWPCYWNNPVSSYSDYPKCSDVVNNFNDSNHSARTCFLWTADLQCKYEVNGQNLATYHGSQAVTKCSAISGLKPQCESSTSSSFGEGNGGSSATPKCHPHPHTPYTAGCTAVYYGGTMIANGPSNMVDGMGSTNNNTAGWNTYCNNKTSQSACEAVGVARFVPAPNTQPNVVKYWGITLPYNVNNGPEVLTAGCCEWSTTGS